MTIQKPKIFQPFSNVLFGFSTKIFASNDDKYNYNMSKSIGDDLNRVEANRNTFFNSVGLKLNNVVIQKQIHSDIVNIIDKYEPNLVGDAVITRSTGIGLAVSTADCTNIFLYDKIEKIICAVHSGWMGTEKGILRKTVNILINKFNSDPKNILAYFGPSICQQNYEVGLEFNNKFEAKYLISKNEKYLLDLKFANMDMLLEVGLDEKQIEVSEYCSFKEQWLHSYRRDGNQSGRALGIIALKGKNES